MIWHFGTSPAHVPLYLLVQLYMVLRTCLRADRHSSSAVIPFRNHVTPDYFPNGKWDFETLRGNLGIINRTFIPANPRLAGAPLSYRMCTSRIYISSYDRASAYAVSCCWLFKPAMAEIEHISDWGWPTRCSLPGFCSSFFFFVGLFVSTNRYALRSYNNFLSISIWRISDMIWEGYM
jgi:hypothetical protein